MSGRVWVSRARLRTINPGQDGWEPCKVCGDMVVFLAKVPSKLRKRIVANVYVEGRWDRVEIFHTVCYLAAGAPYGAPEDMSPEDVDGMRAILKDHPDYDQRQVLDAYVEDLRRRHVQVHARD